jgi:hypothetical protein
MKLVLLEIEYKSKRELKHSISAFISERKSID